ncbi:cytochrome P450 [Marinicellulosiphila megalodicopiae]|uniref:cytochrome P450 n=1 Tax=Marinicellulosiphila megalodicopiae TaxID=2724896 RepID=UPI003BB0CDEB
MSKQHFPGPKPWPIVGNIPDLLGGPGLIQGLIGVGKQHGPLFRLTLSGYSPIFATNYDIINLLCDESKFEKKVSKSLEMVRQLTGDGLFTAYPEEPNWHKAHDLLMPAFSLGALNNYYPAMQNVGLQLVDRWEKNPENINVVDDMTRLTLETIGLCGFGYSFESFEKEDTHPFINGMLGALSETMNRLTRPQWLTAIMKGKQKEFTGNIHYLNEIVDNVIQDRKKESGAKRIDKNDLLSLMLDSKQLDDTNIRNQIITFLIAGHETTSGLLSFALYYLLKHPEALRKTQNEIDSILGEDQTKTPSYRELSRFKYLRQVLNESLRLWPTAPVFAVTPKEKTTLPGGYEVNPGEQISVLIPLLHRDPEVWGDNVELFDPDRFSLENEQNRPENAFKPFGNGQRACIGRQFAIQEATLALVLVLHRFDIIDHTNYELKIKESLTLKPDNFFINVRKRVFKKFTKNDSTLTNNPTNIDSNASLSLLKPVLSHSSNINVYYGSQMGFTEQLAQQYSDFISNFGITSNAMPLNSAVDSILNEDIFAVFAASYNGQPTKNSEQFIQWIESLNNNELVGKSFILFGCGHKDWFATYQQVPKRIYNALINAGATSLLALGEGDAREDILGDFEHWQNSTTSLLNEIVNIKQRNENNVIEVKQEANHQPDKSNVKIQWLIKQASTQKNDLLFDVISVKKLITSENETWAGQKFELVLKSPNDQYYRAGSHLELSVTNPKSLVTRFMKRMRLDDQDTLQFSKKFGLRFLNNDNNHSNNIVNAKKLCEQYLDLHCKISARTLKIFLQFIQCPPEKMVIEQILSLDNHYFNIVDVLEKLPSLSLEFDDLLELIPSLKSRYYSIASCFETNKHIKLIISEVNDNQFTGLASTYFNRLLKGKIKQVKAKVIDLQPDFSINPTSNTHNIMIGAGTGVAPFIGFSELMQSKQIKDKLTLIYGCKRIGVDSIELPFFEKLQSDNYIQLFIAQSQPENKQKKYVQDVLLEIGDQIFDKIHNGAKIFICGDANNMAQSVQQNLKTIAVLHGKIEDSQKWLDQLISNKQLVMDIW